MGSERRQRVVRPARHLAASALVNPHRLSLHALRASPLPPPLRPGNAAGGAVVVVGGVKGSAPHLPSQRRCVPPACGEPHTPYSCDPFFSSSKSSGCLAR